MDLRSTSILTVERCPTCDDAPDEITFDESTGSWTIKHCDVSVCAPGNAVNHYMALLMWNERARASMGAPQRLLHEYAERLDTERVLVEASRIKLLNIISRLKALFEKHIAMMQERG